MRNENYELIRLIMSKGNKYAHDICCLSISEIISLINYNRNLIDALELDEINKYNSAPFKIVFELEEYLEDFNERLGKRVQNFIIG